MKLAERGREGEASPEPRRVVDRCQVLRLGRSLALPEPCGEAGLIFFRRFAIAKAGGLGEGLADGSIVDFGLKFGDRFFDGQ